MALLSLNRGKPSSHEDEQSQEIPGQAWQSQTNLQVEDRSVILLTNSCLMVDFN